jgi:hypothetical protein
VDSPEAVAAYGRLEELCRAIMNELRADDQIRDARVLPAFLHLPDTTALEYVSVRGRPRMTPPSLAYLTRVRVQGAWLSK